MRGVNISCDMHELKDFCNRVNESLGTEYRREFYKACAKELAARMLALVIPRTPTGEYDKEVHFTTKDGVEVRFTPHTGKVGGTLKRGWTAKTHEEAASGKGAPNAAEIIKYAQALPVTDGGGTYTITITNPVEYSQYVEFGHRTATGDGWVKGQFMMTISAREVQQIAPQALERKLEKFLREGMGDK
jgi:hypothetical protein